MKREIIAYRGGEEIGRFWIDFPDEKGGNTMESQIEPQYVVKHRWLWNIGAFLTRVAGQLIEWAGE